jgi:hypothetical protein
MHSTNKVFERYLQVQVEDTVKMYQKTLAADLHRNFTPSNKDKVIEIKKNNGEGGM